MNLSLRLANYITRYAPSRKKISTYLSKKKCMNIDEKLEEIRYDESLMIRMWMRSFLTLGKGEREITQKLMKKEFPRPLIDEMILQFHPEVHDWEEHKGSIEQQIENLLRRGKSKRMVSSLLIGKYSYFHDEIQVILEEKEEKDGLEKELEKYTRRYNFSDLKDIQKVTAALMRKGFRYEDIKKGIKEIVNGES